MVLDCLEAPQDRVLQANRDLQAIQEDPLDLVVLLDLTVQKVPLVQKVRIVQLVLRDQRPLVFPAVLDRPYHPVDLKVLVVLVHQDHLYPQKVQKVQRTRMPRKVLVARIDQKVLANPVDPKDQVDPVARIALSCPRDPDCPYHLGVLEVLAVLGILVVRQIIQVVQLVPLVLLVLKIQEDPKAQVDLSDQVDPTILVRLKDQVLPADLVFLCLPEDQPVR